LTLAVSVVLLALGMAAPIATAQVEHGEEEGAVSSSDASGFKAMGLGIGAGLAVGLAGMGTGRAQAGVGAGGTGAIVEKPELFAQVLILFAIPETLVIFGFVIAILLLGQIG
jgi:V/A-type H+-transporting ATPase subunit K